ncbi:hypothetical protein SAMN06265348_12039 [Pedobacter westerhofensis]|uniref:Uncharacterized protein n=1 Tax=Pedobacter westerhofensis TaxID=425512 RepID=A0A521FST9_9SPHI|nr:hypothetical protein SAMN06265348_12039 [Pedobacter westerhofensis]
MKRIREMLGGNASEQYTDFLNDYINILQRISLGDILSARSRIKLPRRAKKPDKNFLNLYG